VSTAPPIVPLGDQAVLAYLPDEATAVEFASVVRGANLSWLEDVVPAYSSVGVFFDADQIGTSRVTAWLLERATSARGQQAQSTPPQSRLQVIPVCYDFGPDLPRVCEQTRLSADEVIRLHSSTEFTVYAIGFVPGFPYMGYLPKELCGVPRLESPRVRVEPGSVGITGRQTAIYPQASPGGWNLIGRTPLTIVEVAAGYFPLRVGDRARFTPIDAKRHAELEGKRLDGGQ